MWWKKTAREQVVGQPVRSALALALEARMMFDGAVAATAVGAADAAAAADAAGAKGNPADAQQHDSTTDHPAAAPTGTTDQRHEVVFVDSNVRDYQQLVSGLKPGTEVVVLDANKDGLKQMADYLSGRHGVDAIHVLSHGEVGKIQLGNDWLEGGDLPARSELLSAIGQSLTRDGDILLYGCKVGAGGEGQSFLDQLAAATGADVEASSDLTGAASQGGNWVLESHRGPIETATMSLTGYEHLLSAPADENYDDNSLGATFSGSTFILDGIKYTITGGGAGYSSLINNDSFGSPLGNDGNDHYMVFDSNGIGGVSSIKIEAADGSAFRLLGLSIDGVADTNISITPNGGTAVSYASNGLFVTHENINLSANSQFQNITSFTISGGTLLLNLDDLNFDTAVVVPTLTSATVTDTSLKAGETSLVTFTFNTAVSGFTTGDLTVDNGFVSGLSSSDGGITWTGMLTPNSSVTDTTNLITVNLAGVTSVSTGTPGSGTASSNNYAIDNVSPTVTSVTSSTANGMYKAGDVISIQVNFSEAVNVTGTPQLTLETGATDRIANYVSGSGSTTLTFNYTVQAGDRSADLDYVSTSALAMNGGILRDGFGNDSNLTLAAPGAAGSLGANKDIVINSAPVIANLGGDSVTFTQGSGSILLDSGSDATVTDIDSPDFNGGNLRASFAANGVSAEDVLGVRNQGTGAGQIGVSGTDVTFGGAIIGSLSGGSAGSDLVISFNANATAAAVQALVHNLTYDNSNASNGIGQLARTVRVSVNDGDGATSSNADLTVAVVETVPPTATLGVADTALAVGETTTVTVTFSEAVTGLDLGDFTVSNGTLSNLSTLDNITWTATLTPTANLQAGSNHISLDNTGYSDQTGNAGVGTTDSNNYAIDTLRPTATIVVADPTLAAGETTTVTITFSEAVTGLGLNDLTATGGTLSNLSTADNLVWTATLTPATGIEGSGNFIILDNTGVADLAGNAGAGTTNSGSYAIDTLRPTATIVVADTALAVGETSLVTITLSEAISGLTTADFTVANGVLSNLSSSNGGITWTATLTPTAGLFSAANMITLDNTGLADGAGNAGTGTTNSNSFLIDTEAPVNGVPGSQTTNTVTPLVFSSANGNAITVSDGGSLSVLVSVSGGSLNANTGGTATIVGNGSGSVTISGTVAQVNAALEGLTYQADGGGVRTLSIQSTDSAGNIDTDTVALTVNNSTLLVTSNLDSGADQTAGASFAADQADGNGLSLREALFWARSGDRITFDLDPVLAGNQGGTITLNGTQLDIHYSNLKIDGDLNDDGVADVTISANHGSRVMAVGSSLSGVEITGLTLTQGTTGAGGGGLYVNTGSNVTLRDSVISNNTDTGGGGGGLYATASTVTVINSTISGNTSNTFGGGIRVVSAGGGLNLINSTVTGNTTTGTGAHGGGLQFGGTNPLVIINSTFSGNAALGASSFGGGIRITSGTSFLYNVTVVGNAATSSGGGINANGTDTFVNTVVAGNTSGAGATAAVGGSPLATGGSADDVGGSVEVATNSYFGSNVSITINNGSLNNQGTASLLLGNLVNNGGTLLTHKPLAGSALLHAGSSAALPADTFDLDGDGNTSEALPIDSIGNARAAGSSVDIGAVQANAAPVLSNLNGGGSYTEGGVAIVIDSDVSVADADLDALNGGAGDYSGASLVVVRQAGADASDLFGFLAGNGITRVGNALVKNGQAIASFDTSVAGQLTLTFTNANGQTPTGADVNHILQQLTYANASHDPAASVTLDWTFADEQGAATQGSSLLSLVAVNDAPVVSANGGNATFTENGSAVDLFGGVSINTVEAGQSIIGLTFTVSGLSDGASEILRIDGTDIALVHGASGLTAGSGIAYSVSLVGGTASVTLSHAALSVASAQGVIDAMSYRNASDAPGIGNRTITLVGVRDNGGTANGGVDSTSVGIAATVSVVAVNDAPSISAPGSIAVIEDTPQPLSGISFADVDADSGSVSVHFNVASGTLSAGSGAGVSVSGSGTGSLTLVGSIVDINAFIAANGLSFTGAANANGTVTLGISIDDGGNSGSGGALTDSTSVTLALSAVNDAPVNSVPGSQSLDQDGSLVFSAGNGNLISISDVDTGGGTLQVTLTATHGVLTLGSLTGLSFSTGDGSADATLVFSGSLADINNALNGLTFSPAGGYNGPASVQVSTSDLGNSGSGGALLDTDTIAISVDPINPVVTHIGVSNPNGSYHPGEVITVTVTFDQTVIVDTGSGVPTLLLETGLIDRGAVYLSGSGSNTLTFLYTVQAGDLSTDLNHQSSGALALNGGSIRNAGNRDAILTLPATGGTDSIAAQHDIVIDGVAPTVTSVAVPANGTYVAGQSLDFTVNLSEATTVDTTLGTPRIAITLDDGGTVFAQYLSGSGSNALVFRLVVSSGQLDTNGISVGSSIQANGGTLRDAVGNDANTTLNNVASTTGVRVDALGPVVDSVTVPAGLSYNAGDVLTFVVNASEAVQVDTAGGTPRLSLDIGGATVFANYVAGSGTSTLVFQYSIQPGENDSDGIQVTGLSANGGRLSDAAGNAMNLGLNQVGDSHAVLVDTRAPEVTSVVRLDPSPTGAQSVNFLVSFDENVSGVDSADFSVITSNSAKGSVQAVTQVDARTWRVTVGGISGQGNLGLSVNVGGISDIAGNPLAQGFSGDSYTIGSISDGDPQYRVTTPSAPPLPSPTPLQPNVPAFVAPPSLSPVLPPSLFEPPSLGGLPPLGNIFTRNGAPTQSFLSQVFGDASYGDGSARGFLGFGGGDAGVFGSSTLSGLFNRDGFDDSTPLKVFERRSGDINQGLHGVFGAPTLAQQLQQIHESEQQPVRDLAWALGQIAQDREAS
ncbi:Ig-like domain-containing protein [Pseudomonas sp. 30_B]|uniref:Ig-like domain-containing protein n=1 Tax=Pseudomonas sp. 30_B TaxID=2813575 RepID=UPI001A9EF08B|nr:Ig-like domain-containing protein [Pseudomonas sp. 30_B]